MHYAKSQVFVLVTSVFLSMGNGFGWFAFRAMGAEEGAVPTDSEATTRKKRAAAIEQLIAVLNSNDPVQREAADLGRLWFGVKSSLQLRHARVDHRRVPRIQLGVIAHAPRLLGESQHTSHLFGRLTAGALGGHGQRAGDRVGRE